MSPTAPSPSDDRERITTSLNDTPRSTEVQEGGAIARCFGSSSKAGSLINSYTRYPPAQFPIQIQASDAAQESTVQNRECGRQPEVSQRAEQSSKLLFSSKSCPTPILDGQSRTEESPVEGLAAPGSRLVSGTDKLWGNQNPHFQSVLQAPASKPA